MCLSTANAENKVSIGSKFLLFFFIYVIFIWFCEVSDLIVFLSGGKNHYVYVSAVISALLTSSLCYKLRKRFYFAEQTDAGCIFLAGSVFIALFGFCKCIMPDGATDTWNYHLVAQEPGFVNYFDDHFALGNFQVWGFRLGDRLFYIFRAVLGYRVGTLLNSLVLILAYYQLIQLMQIFNKQLTKQVANFVIEISALVICLAQWILFDMGIYYVDIIAFPVALEVIRLLMKACTVKPSQSEILYFALLNGFWLTFKMTNVVYVAPAIILFMLLTRNVKFKTLVCACILCAMPFMVYMVFNYYCTGNPIYPYYNTIFKSELFPIANFKDGRWGPTTTIKKITWIYHAIFNPEDRLAEICDEFKTRYIVTFLLLVTLIVLYIRSKLKKQKVAYYHMELVVFVLVSSVLWGFSTGYGRYYMFGIMITEFVACGAVFIIYTELQHDRKLFKSAVGLLAGFLLFGEFLLLASVMYGTEWSWRYTFPTKNNPNITKNIQYVLHDQKYEGTFDTSEVDAFIISEPGKSGYAYWFNKNSYTFMLDYLGSVDAEHQKYYRAKLAEVLHNNDQVYDIVSIGTDMGAYTQKMAGNGIAVENVFQNDTNVGNVMMVKLKPLH